MLCKPETKKSKIKSSVSGYILNYKNINNLKSQKTVGPQGSKIGFTQRVWRFEANRSALCRVRYFLPPKSQAAEWEAPISAVFGC
jgi:hypothetical protein